MRGHLTMNSGKHLDVREKEREREKRRKRRKRWMRRENKRRINWLLFFSCVSVGVSLSFLTDSIVVESNTLNFVEESPFPVM